MATALKECPCGETPQRLYIEVGDCGNRLWTRGTCCGDWSVEFRSDYQPHVKEIMAHAVEAWNAAPRVEQ